MRVIFGDETTDFERFWFDTDASFLPHAEHLLSCCEVSAREGELVNVTSLLPYPRSNIYSAISYLLGSLPEVKFADASGVYLEELRRWFACFPPHVLIGSSALISECSVLPDTSWRNLQAVVFTDSPFKLAAAKSFLWTTTVSHSGIEQVIHAMD